MLSNTLVFNSVLGLKHVAMPSHLRKGEKLNGIPIKTISF